MEDRINTSQTKHPVIFIFIGRDDVSGAYLLPGRPERVCGLPEARVISEGGMGGISLEKTNSVNDVCDAASGRESCALDCFATSNPVAGPGSNPLPQEAFSCGSQGPGNNDKSQQKN